MHYHMISVSQIPVLRINICCYCKRKDSWYQALTFLRMLGLELCVTLTNTPEPSVIYRAPGIDQNSQLVVLSVP